MPKNKKILLIGGTGVLSSAITKELVCKKFDVTMLNRGIHASTIPESVVVFKADIHDENTVRKILQGKSFDAVIDFICYTSKDIEYSFNLFKDFVEQYIFISSCAVYDSRVDGVHSEQAKKTLDIWDYSVNKVKCENTLLYLAKQHDKQVTIIRPAVTYGNTRIPYGITPAYGYHGTLVQRILNNKPIILWDGGKARCNIMRVEDFAVGVAGIIGKSEAYGQAYNICGDPDKASSWLEVLNTLEKVLDCPIKKIDIPSEFYANEMPWKKGEILGGRALTNISNNQKIKQIEPSFRDSISLYDGLKSTVDWYKSQNWLSGIDYKFDGDADRIICKFIKKQKINANEFNLKFTDYLFEKKIINRLKYFYGKNGNNLLFRGLRMIVKKIKGFSK